MSRRRRGSCPACGRDVAVTSSGRVWAHYLSRGALCDGTGRVAGPAPQLAPS